MLLLISFPLKYPLYPSRELLPKDPAPLYSGAGLFIHHFLFMLHLSLFSSDKLGRPDRHNKHCHAARRQ